MSGTCKDCKWWGEGWALSKQLGYTGENPRGWIGKRYCGSEYLCDSVTRTGSPDGLALDVPAGMVMPVTGPDFGCIHFEQKVEP